MPKNHFLLLIKLKNTASAQLCSDDIALYHRYGVQVEIAFYIGGIQRPEKKDVILCVCVCVCVYIIMLHCTDCDCPDIH